MNWILNSPFTNYLLKLAFSKSGVVVRWLVGYIVGGVATLNIIPTGDVENIRLGLTSGLTALFAILYAAANYWLNKRNADGAKVVQTMIKEVMPSADVKIDGVIGNKTVLAAAQVTETHAPTIIQEVRGDSLRDQLD